MILRSREHGDPAYVRFENKTGRSIDVVWSNYNGDLIRYGTLEPGEFLDINTFKTHPWMFIDRGTGVKMQVGSGRVFYPIPCREIIQRLGLNVRTNFRVPVPVSLPVFTLKEISLHAIMKRLKSMDGVESLELPSSLLSELQCLSRQKEVIMSLYNAV